jgi:adsorption protein B
LKSRDYDFIQIPVFSFKVPKANFVAGIYMDEFAEAHTQNLIVRDRFKAGVPSAGVGTAVSRSAISHLIKAQGGYFLNENTLTEDYFLGLTCYDLNIKAHFASEYFEERDAFRKGNVKDYIATREYFPEKVSTSVRQKTRWIMGICLQSYEQKKRKSSNLFGSYFLWRDRKSLWSAPIFISSVIFLTYYTVSFLLEGRWPQLNYLPYQKLLNTIILANFVFSVWSLLRRMVLVSRVYDKTVALMVPVRWITSYYVNNAATFNAVYQWVRSKIKGQIPKWSKTDHVIPVGFGMANFKFVESEAAIPVRAPVRVDNEL